MIKQFCKPTAQSVCISSFSFSNTSSGMMILSVFTENFSNNFYICFHVFFFSLTPYGNLNCKPGGTFQLSGLDVTMGLLLTMCCAEARMSSLLAVWFGFHQPETHRHRVLEALCAPIRDEGCPLCA